MKATITNIAKEGDRVRIFVSYSDGTESSFLQFPNTTEEAIRAEICEVLKMKKETEEKTNELKSKLINLEIE